MEILSVVRDVLMIGVRTGKHAVEDGMEYLKDRLYEGLWRHQSS